MTCTRRTRSWRSPSSSPPGVTATLNESQRYGVSWFGRRKVAQKQVVENGTYRVKTKSTIRAREEQIPVPTPDPGIPREWVDAAREAIRGNKAPSAVSGRSWELSGGILYRGDRGGRMATHTTIERKGGGKGKRYHHYRCPKRRRHGVVDSCPNAGHRRAEPLEDKIWGVVAGCSRTRRGCAEDWKS